MGKNKPVGPDQRAIGEMRNLGPACEAALNAAGIRTAEELKRLGAEGAFLKMLASRRLAGQARNYCHAAFLYALYGAIHDLDWKDVPEAKKQEFKALTAEIRNSGQLG